MVAHLTALLPRLKLSPKLLVERHKKVKYKVIENALLRCLGEYVPSDFSKHTMTDLTRRLRKVIESDDAKITSEYRETARWLLERWNRALP